MNSRKFCYGDNNQMSKRRLLMFLILSLILFVAVLMITSCGKKEKKAEKERQVNVRVAAAQSKQIQPYIETTGTLKPDEEVTVSSEVDGIVKKIKVEEGTPVHSGMLLVEINEIDYLLEWKRTDAALKQVQANLANAKAEFKRKESLFQEELISKQQFDDVTTKLALAEADLDRAKATLETSKEKLSRTKVYSPLVGAVKEKRISVGDYVRNGTPILQLIKTDPLKLNFTISEKDTSSLKIGQQVSFTVDSYSGKEFKGKVTLLYPHVEEKTRTLQAEALVPNGNHELKPGFFAKAVIYTSAPRSTILIPITALIYDSSLIRIFVVEGEKARQRTIKIGGKYGEYIEVTEGVKENEQVVIVGQNNLAEGVKVNVDR